jgi:hypothetical protein
VQRVPVRLAIDGNRANTQFIAGIYNPKRDFPAIGNQNLTKHAFPLKAEFALLAELAERVPSGNQVIEHLHNLHLCTTCISARFALYQGTTLVVPIRPTKNVGFSPCKIQIAA